MGTHHTPGTASVLDHAAARAEQMPHCLEREAAGREWDGRCTRAIDLLIRAGVREAIATLNTEGEWIRKSRGSREP